MFNVARSVHKNVFLNEIGRSVHLLFGKFRIFQVTLLITIQGYTFIPSCYQTQSHTHYESFEVFANNEKT